MKKILITVYIDYLNNFKDVESFAREHQLTVEEISIILTAGKNLYELQNRNKLAKNNE